MGYVIISLDVFVFGVFLFEVVCGRKFIEFKVFFDELVLVDWVWFKWREEKVMDVVDFKLKG